MKKIKFLPLFLVAPLLVGCNNVKQPKFAKEGDAVEFDKFADDLSKKSAEASFAKEAKLGSLVFKSTNQSSEESKRTRSDKTVVNQSSDFEETKTDGKYDANNLLISAKGSTKQNEQSKSLYGTSKTSLKSNSETFVQEFSKEDKKYVVTGNKKAKELQKMVELSDLVKAEDYFDLMMKALVANGGSRIQAACEAYALADEEAKKNYKFYENGDIFTVEFKEVVENEEHKNGEDKVEYVVNGSDSFKIQIDLTEGKWKSKYYRETSEKIEHKLDHGSYLEGEVTESLIKASEDVEINSKDVKLKAVDVSKYKEDIK